jgi:hypothetical protein
MLLTKLRLFLPSLDYQLSIRFYQKIGFEIAWQSDSLTIMKHRDLEFFIQNAIDIFK